MISASGVADGAREAEAQRLEAQRIQREKDAEAQRLLEAQWI